MSDKAIALLRRLEWSGRDGDGEPCCPRCYWPSGEGRAKGRGHGPGCDLRAALDEADRAERTEPRRIMTCEEREAEAQADRAAAHAREPVEVRGAVREPTATVGTADAEGAAAPAPTWLDEVRARAEKARRAWLAANVGSCACGPGLADVPRLLAVADAARALLGAPTVDDVPHTPEEQAAVERLRLALSGKAPT